MHPQIEFIIGHLLSVMVLAICGNLFLIFVIFRGNHVIRQKISPVQLLLLHTCVADLLFALFSLGSESLILSTYPYFYASETVCKLVRYLQAIPLYASPFLLVAISVDRYQAICRPLANYRSDRYRRPTLLALIAWTLALVCSIPQIFVWHKSPEGECATVYGGDSSTLKYAYVIGFNTTAWLLPSALSAGFYYKVCNTVWQSRCAMARRVSVKERSGSIAQMSFHTRDYLNRLRSLSPSFQNQSSKFDKKRIQTIRLTLTIIACNFFLWAPFCLVNIIQAFAPSLLDAEVITYIVILGNLNSCCNPWIYLIFNRKFTQRALCSLVPWMAPRKCRDRSSLSYQSSRKYPTWNGKGNESTSPANETMSTAVTAKLIAC